MWKWFECNACVPSECKCVTRKKKVAKQPRKGKAFWIARDLTHGQEYWACTKKPVPSETVGNPRGGGYFFDDLCVRNMRIKLKPSQAIKVRLVEVKK